MSDDTIWVVTRDEEELTQEETNVLVEACREYWENDANNPHGDPRKADAIVRAATKLGIYTPD